MSAAWRLRPSAADIGRVGGLIALGAFLAVFCALVTVAAPILLRLAFYLTIATMLVALALMRPRTGIVATVVFLVFLAFVRRLLIEDAGWSSVDPLLLVGPTVAFVLAVQLFVVRRRPVAPDHLSLLVLAVLLLSVVEVANPTGAGIGANLVALLFVAVPLVWFFVGRELATPALVERLLLLTVLLGVVVAAYGLWQTEVGMPSWDRTWVDTNGYDALRVGDQVRAFGTLSSSAEYALLIGAALVIAVAFSVGGRTDVLLAVPVLAAALFLASARGALIKGAVGVILVLALSTRRLSSGLAVLAVGAVVAAGLLFGLGGLSGSGNSLVAHQVGGLADPLNPGSSTLLVHLKLVLDGIVHSLDYPFGSGTGAATIGGDEGSSSYVRGSEFDISDAFINLGVLGGLAYLATVGLTLVWAVRGYLAGSALLLPIAGVLVAGFGQWLTGRHYALASLTWLLIGAVAADAARRARLDGASGGS